MSANSADDAASAAKISWNECAARNAAAALPAANPRLEASRSTANVVTRWPSGTRSATSALLAGRYISEDTPTTNAVATMAP